ncbi:MAG: LysM peptidoglycan-binding domain-containing protein, partial [Ilumatobacteraceae bacterium]
NPGGAAQQQAPSGTIDMSKLPLLNPDGESSASPVAAQSTCSGKYTVVSGDSWSLIADKVSVSVSSLLDVNDATTSTMLHVGDVLCLPKGASSPTTNAPVTTKAPSTTVKTTTTVAAPSGPYYSPAQIEAIIRDVWPDNLEDTALMIAIRESKLNPYVHNWCCYGLFQIYWEVHDVWLIPRGVTSAAQLYDPRTNATAAYWIYQRSGSFAPWGM